MLREHVELIAADGIKLEGELVTPSGEPRAAAVLTHPHPRHGGNMRSMVPGELIEELPAVDVVTLRFNFRGMGSSEGTFTDGDLERLDVVAAIDALHELTEGLPLAVVGSSFGADTALSVDDARISGWCAVAPPLRDHKLELMKSVASSNRPKLLVVPERDQFRKPDPAREVTRDWQSTTIHEIPGADHFLVGRLDQAITTAVNFVKTLPPPQ